MHFGGDNEFEKTRVAGGPETGDREGAGGQRLKNRGAGRRACPGINATAAVSSHRLSLEMVDWLRICCCRVGAKCLFLNEISPTSLFKP